MLNWILTASAIGTVTWIVLAYRRNTRRLMALYGDEYRAYNSHAFRDIVEPSPKDGFEFVTRLATEVASRKGQRAIIVRCLERALAIHHINRDGTFSAKGPYFVSTYTGNWRRTGKKHLVKLLRGKGGWGFSPDHYNQTGVISERGVAVLEYDTSRFAPVTIREFVSLRSNAQKKTEDAGQ